jgi:Ser/Thr protein kinase RdoA (MazF antagonist)
VSVRYTEPAGIIAAVPCDHLLLSMLRGQWHLQPEEITVLPSGALSRLWSVTTAAEEEYVARLAAPGAARGVEAGLLAALHLRGRGIAAGEPVRTLSGALTVESAAGTLAVLRRVPGRPLRGADPVDQQWWGDRLGAVHRELQEFTHPGLSRWNTLSVRATHLSVEPWLRSAVSEVVAAAKRLTVTDRLTYGVLLGDPAPDEFVVDPATGRAGVLDCGAAGTGPLVLDVAAAVIYAGGVEAATEFLDGYLAAGPVRRDELEAALPVLTRFRWAYQADWSARRLTRCRVPSCLEEARGMLRAARSALAAAPG